MNNHVYLFVATGCSACTDYWPRFREICLPYMRKGMRVYVGDITNSYNAQKLAEQFKIEATPTTIVNTQRGLKTLVGAVTARQLENAFNACEI